MYDELVKDLRENHDKYFARDMQAADAIEGLSKLADAIPHVCECCVGCELEKKNGGCNHAFVLSPKRAKVRFTMERLGCQANWLD